jgi:RimJ/RimL family protein N-acetyltransferase
MRAIPTPPDPFTDGRIRLRLSAERDIPEILIAYQDDSHLHERLGEERPPSGAQLGRMMEISEADREDGTAIRLTITDTSSDDCRGQIVAHRFDWEHSRCELTLWVAPQRRGRGFARSALRLVSPWLVQACGLRRMALLTEPDNEPMLRTARAAGFAEEGTLRGYERRNGRRVDIIVLSLTSEDLVRWIASGS